MLASGKLRGGDVLRAGLLPLSVVSEYDLSWNCFSGQGEGFRLEFCGVSFLRAGIGVEGNRLVDGKSVAPVMTSGFGLAFVEDCCRSVLCLEDSYMVNILFVAMLKADATSLSVTIPLVKGGGERMGLGVTALLGNGGMAEALFIVALSCDLLNKVVSEPVVFAEV